MVLATAGWVHAGEFVISAQDEQIKNSASNAADNSTKAQTYSQSESQTPATIIVTPADGMLVPPSVGRPPDNRSKARSYIKDDSLNKFEPAIIWLENSPKNMPPSRANLEKNLNKARSYSDNGTSNGIKPGTYVRYGTAVGVVAADGVIVFACEQISNTAGRIGDDSQSGNAFTLSLNNKFHQARCK